MGWNLVVTGALLLGQASAAPLPGYRTVPPAATVAPPTTIAPATVAPSRATVTPPQMIVEALAPRAGTALTGQPLTLAAALGATAERRQQWEVTQAYWGLVEAVALYHFCLDHQKQLSQWTARPENALLLRTAQASSLAALREAESKAISAQHDLAALLSMPVNMPLPLPADRPHVGPYRTNVNELFGTAGMPPRAKLIDQTLPWLRRAIDVRASAITAADEATTAATAAYQAGRGDLSIALLCAAESHRQRRAFADLVCRYNDQIADYALNVARVNISGAAVVGMLIGPPRDQVRPTSYEDDGTGMSRPATSPTPARPPVSPQQEPTVAPPRELQALPRELQALPRELQALPRQQEAPSDESKQPAVPGALPRSMLQHSPAPVDGSSAEPRAVNRVAIDGAASPHALYPALVQAEPSVKASQLATTLHWDRSLPQGMGEPITVEECLRGRSAVERWPILAAYWTARHRAAQCQAFAQQTEMLETLSAMAARRDRSADGQTVPRLRTLQLSTEAAVQESLALLAEAQLELASRIGRESSARWPLPTTVPHAGTCLLKLDVQPPELQGSRAVQRWVSMLPLEQKALEDRAVAIVEADVARAALTSQYDASAATLEDVLAAVGQEADETLAFLRLLTDYNHSIGQYALAVLPPATSSEQLSAALVAAK